MKFKKYIHLEKYGTDEVEGIEFGECYIFPKIDGTNASLWYNNGIQAGSRKIHLTLEADNAGFYAWAADQVNIELFFDKYPNARLYGEWLVPHSLKTYKEDAWRKFYVFDVMVDDDFIKYDIYKPLLEEFDIDFIPPLCVLKNGGYDAMLIELENNKFLIEDGKGSGEGIALKNYSYKNRFGRVCWAKMVSNDFKEKHVKSMGPTIKNGKQMIEQEIVDAYVTKSLVDKVYAKISNEMDGWRSKYIPRLLQTVFYDLVNEEIWTIVKKMKHPTINFRTLNTITIMRVKEIMPELF